MHRIKFYAVLIPDLKIIQSHDCTEKNSWSNFTQLTIKFGTYGQVRSYLVSL